MTVPAAVLHRKMAISSSRTSLCNHCWARAPCSPPPDPGMVMESTFVFLSALGLGAGKFAAHILRQPVTNCGNRSGNPDCRCVALRLPSETLTAASPSHSSDLFFGKSNPKKRSTNSTRGQPRSLAKRAELCQWESRRTVTLPFRPFTLRFLPKKFRIAEKRSEICRRRQSPTKLRSCEKDETKKKQKNWKFVKTELFWYKIFCRTYTNFCRKGLSKGVPLTEWSKNNFACDSGAKMSTAAMVTPAAKICSIARCARDARS